MRKILVLLLVLSSSILNVKAQSGCWKIISANNGYCIAIKNDGTLWDWGYNTDGQLGDGTYENKYSPVQIGTSNNWETVTAGYSHFLAIKTDGTLWACGSNIFGQLGDGTNSYKGNLIQIGTDNNWKTVSSGAGHTLALKTNGTLWVWGNNYYGQLGDGTNTSKNTPVQIGSANNWATIQAGYNYGLGLKSDGTLWAWGYNNYGQLGDGTNTNKNTPIQIGTSNNWKKISALYDYTLALKTDGTLWAWGNNNYGQLGDGTTTNKNIPVQIGLGTNWENINAGCYHTLAIKTDGTLWAWGANNYGQLGDGTTTNINIPLQIGIANNWKTVSVGTTHTLALKNDATLWAWGYNASGQLGNGIDANKKSPIQIGISPNWYARIAGYNHTLVVKNDGTLWACGFNGFQQLGDGTNIDKKKFVQISNANNWKKVFAGNNHTLAIKTDGTLWAWGDNYFGELGDGTNTSKSTPVKIGTANNWETVSAGYGYTLAIKTDGTLWAWGYNQNGQLGNGTYTNKNIPTQLGTVNNWKIVSTGYRHTLAIKTDGTLWAWGNNQYGQLGDGTNIIKNNPVQIGTTNNWETVSAGYMHTLAIKTDGTLWTWGENSYGQLGDGTTYINKNSPIQIGSANNWQSVKAGYNYTLSIKTDGTLWAWGDNTVGQLGDGTIHNNKNSPMQIGTINNWQSINAGYNHTLATKTDGTLWAWGDNSAGQLGDGTTWQENPLKISTCFGNCLPAKTFTSNFSSCNNVFYNGNIYTTSLVLSDTIMSTYGCDSIYKVVNIVIQPNSVSGNIIHPTKGGINKAILKVTGSNNYSREVSKVFMDSCNTAGNAVTYRFTKNNDITKANGLNATDVLFVQRHILGSPKLNSAYKIIAADVNGDKLVNATDLLRIKRLILGTDTTFTKGSGAAKIDRLWEFVDSAYQFPDTTNPFPFKDSISFTNLTSNKINQTFIGVKLGDVNDSWNAAVAKQSTVNSIQLTANVDFKTINGELRIPITVSNFKDIVAMQYTFHFDNTKYEFVNLEGFKNLQGFDYNATQANTNGNISMLWTDKNAVERILEDGTELFTLVLRAKEFGVRNLELVINDAITEIAAWDKDYNQHNIILTKRETINEQPETRNDFLSVSPNPTSGEIKVSILSKVNKTVSFELTDAQGKAILKQVIELQKGSNNITLNLKQNGNLTTGIYFLKAAGLEGENVKRITVK